MYILVVYLYMLVHLYIKRRYLKKILYMYICTLHNFNVFMYMYICTRFFKVIVHMYINWDPRSCTFMVIVCWGKYGGGVKVEILVHFLGKSEILPTILTIFQSSETQRFTQKFHKFRHIYTKFYMNFVDICKI